MEERELPVGWVKSALGDFVEFVYGKSLPARTREVGDVPVYGSNGVVGTHKESLAAAPCIIIGRKGSVGEIHLSEKPAWPIRDATNQEYQKEVENEIEDVAHDDMLGKESELDQTPPNKYPRLNAFSFLRIAQHFFPEIIFEPHKVDGFTQDIVRCSPLISRGIFNYYMRENIAKVKAYASRSKGEQNPDELLSPYSIIRHCLYLGDKEKFSTMLSNDAKATLDKWIAGSSQHQDAAGGGSASVVTA